MKKTIIFTLIVLFSVSVTSCAEKPLATPTSTPYPTVTPSTAANVPTDIPSTQTSAPISFPEPCFISFTQATDTGAEIVVADCSKDPPIFYDITETTGNALYSHLSPNRLLFAYLYYDFDYDSYNFWVADIAQKNDAEDFRRISDINIDMIGDYSWTSDSQHLIFSMPQPDGAEYDVYRMDIETGEMVNLTEDSPTWDAFPTSSPTALEIAFVSDRADEGKTADNIWVMDMDGNNLRQLTNTAIWENGYPSWSPDGTEIAFFRTSFLDAEPEKGPAGLWVVNAQTGEERLIAELDIIRGTESPTWSPDGKFIAFSDGFENRDIMVVSVADGTLTQVSDLPGDESDANWSHDSQFLIFTYAYEENGSRDWQLYKVKPDGNELQPVFEFTGNFLGEWILQP